MKVHEEKKKTRLTVTNNRDISFKIIFVNLSTLKVIKKILFPYNKNRLLLRWSHQKTDKKDLEL